MEALAEQIAALKAGGMTLLMAEQNLGLALALADRICILDKGHVRFTGSVEAFEADESLRLEYLTVDAGVGLSCVPVVESGTDHRSGGRRCA